MGLKCIFVPKKGAGEFFCATKKNHFLRSGYDLFLTRCTDP